MGDVRLSSPRIRVVRDGVEPIELQTDNRDLILWDATRVKHKWPKFDEAPFLWLTFLSWAAARRTGAITTAHTFEAWRDEVLEVTSVDDDEDDAGRPTEPGPDPG
jgi:hypothetical protein